MSIYSASKLESSLIRFAGSDSTSAIFGFTVMGVPLDKIERGWGEQLFEEGDYLNTVKFRK